MYTVRYKKQYISGPSKGKIIPAMARHIDREGALRHKKYVKKATIRNPNTDFSDGAEWVPFGHVTIRRILKM